MHVGPLVGVKPGEYELIELNTKVSTSIPIWITTVCGRLHDALGRYHASGSVSEERIRLAREVLRSYGSLVRRRT